MSRRLVILATLGAALSAAPATASAAGPAPLWADTTAADVNSTYGSGSFGQWGVDEWGLPVYHYTDDELTDPHAAQAESSGSSAAQHQVGNDNIKGMAYNDGYTQLWSQQLLAQWANLYAPANAHYAGGYGYLSVGGKVGSTEYADHQTGESFQRDFGVGYARKAITFAGLSVREDTVAPWGSDPVLLDNVTITNTTSSPINASWFEYWDVNPAQMIEGHPVQLGLQAPAWSAAERTLSDAQLPGDPRDVHPLSEFASALSPGAVSWETSAQSFFGSGNEAVPAEVAHDHLAAASPSPTHPATTATPASSCARRCHSPRAPR